MDIKKNVLRDCSIASGSRAYFYASGKLRKIQSSSDISCSLCVQAWGRWIEFPYRGTFEPDT